MKKILICVFLMVGLVVSCSKKSGENVQEAPAELQKSELSSIRNVDWEKNCVNPFMFGKYGYTNPFGACYSFPDFYMIGFSKDGKAAICLNEEIDGRGGNVVTFRVQDLVTDEVLCEFDWDSYEYSGQDYEEHDQIFASESVMSVFAKEKGNEIDKLLGQYSIIVQPCEFVYFPKNDDVYGLSFDVSIEDTGKRKYEVFQIVNYSISARKNGEGAKRLTFQQDVVCENVHVCGYFKSPYEERVVLVAGEEHYIFEGNGLRYRLFGCDLNKGFE